MARRLRKLLLNEISLVPDGMNPGARVVLFKMKMPCADCPDPAACQADGTCKMENMMPDVTKADIDRMIADAVAKALADEDAKNTRIAKAKEDGAAEAKKAADAVALTAKADADAAVKKEKDRADAAEAEVAKQKRSVAAAARVAKLKKDYPNLALAEIEKSAEAIEALPEEARKAIESTLAAANEQVAKGKLFAELGTSAPASPESAIGRIEAAARQIQKGKPALTFDQAVEEAARANPALYEEHKKEVKRAAN